MNDTRNHKRPGHGAEPPEEPLPRTWLPEALPAANDPYWEHAAARIVTTLEPLIAAREASAGPRARSWVSEIGEHWAAASLSAAAAVALLLLVGTQEPARGPTPGADDLALALIASEGDPVMLQGELGITVDPVLAWLTFGGALP